MITGGIFYRAANVIVAFFFGFGLCVFSSAAQSVERSIRVWCHQGQEAENEAMRQIAHAFNEAHVAQHVWVEITFFPDFQYTEKTAIAAAAHDLPDVFDLDGPLVARYVNAGLLTPLNGWFDETTVRDFLPSIVEQGTIEGKLYALGSFDSALVLYYDRMWFEKAGVLAPPENSSWTWSEFLDASKRLRAVGIEPVAMHMNESADEWYTYAFTPIIWSLGGSLISSDGHTVRGILSSAANVRGLCAWQQLFKEHFAATDPVDTDPFGHGKPAMNWSGHWMARSHVVAKGDRVGVWRLPKTGERSVSTCGSWGWGISSQTTNPVLAAEWIKWVTDSHNGIAPLVRANGAVPSRISAFALFPEYWRPPYELFRAQLENQAQPTPRTPYYATLTQRFAAALRDIAHGAEVEARLRLAEDQIQKVIDRRSAGSF